MKNTLKIMALGLVFVFGCKQMPTESDPLRVNDPNHPNSAKDGGTSDACFDIPTPINVTAVLGDENTDGQNVDICWEYQTPPDSYYTGTTWYPQGAKKPARWSGYVPTSTLNPTYIYQFWGGSQRSIVQSPSYSGHYDVFRSTDGGTNWEKIGETRDLCFTDEGPNGTGVTDGDYMYAVKAKSLEGSSPNQCTHHSFLSDGAGITVDFCVEEAIEDTYSLLGGVFGDNVVWTGNNFSISNSGNLNPHWAFHIVTNTQNSCTGEVTGTETEEFYMGDLCVSLVGGPNNLQLGQPWYPAHWQSEKYHLDGVLPNPGPGTYTLYYYKCHLDDDDNIVIDGGPIGSSVVTVTE